MKLFVFSGRVLVVLSYFLEYVVGQILLPVPMPLLLPGAVPVQPLPPGKLADDFSFLDKTIIPDSYSSFISDSLASIGDLSDLSSYPTYIPSSSEEAATQQSSSTVSEQPSTTISGEPSSTVSAEPSTTVSAEPSPTVAEDPPSKT